MTGRLTHSLSAIARGSAFVFTCRIIGAVFTLLLQVMLARWMGAAELGIYVLAFSWCILLATFGHLGLATAAIRVIGQALAKDRSPLIWGFLKRAAQIVFVASVIMAAVGTIAIVLSRDQFGDSGIAPFLLAMSIVPVLAYINVRCSVAVAFHWIAQAFLWTEVIRPISICVIVAAIWWLTNRLDASMVMSVQLSVMIGIAVVLYAILRQRIKKEIPTVPPEFDDRGWMRLSLPLLVITLFGNYFPEFMLILIGIHVPSDQVAIFNASFRLALIVNFALGAVGAVTSPVASRLYAAHKLDELQGVVTRAAHLGFWSSMAAVAGYATLGRVVLGFFGPEFIAGYDTMMILVVAQLIRAAAGPVIPLLSVTGHQDSCLIVFASALIASIALIFLLVPMFGIRGAAASVLLVTIGWSIWLHRLVVLRVGVRPSIFGAFSAA